MGGSLSKCEEDCKKAIQRKDLRSLESALQNGTCDVFKITNPDENPEIYYRCDFILKTLNMWRFFGNEEVLGFLQHLKSAVEKNRLNKNEKLIPSPQWGEMKVTYLGYVMQEYKHQAKNDKDVFLFFLDNDDLFPHNKPGYSLLHQLCEKPATIEPLRELISSGKLDEKYKNSNSASDDDMKTSAAFEGKTPLQVACEKRNVEAVKELCSAGIGGKNYGDSVDGMLQTRANRILWKDIDELKEAEMIEICLCLFSQPGSDAIRKCSIWNDPDVKSDLEKRFPKLRDVLVQNGCGEKKEEEEKKDEKEEDKSDKTEEDSK